MGSFQDMSEICKGPDTRRWIFDDQKIYVKIITYYISQGNRKTFVCRNYFQKSDPFSVRKTRMFLYFRLVAYRKL